MAASVTCTSTGSSRTWGPGWGQGLQAPGLHRAPPDSGWATGWSQAASPAREAPASRVTATQQGIAASPAPATQAGREHCVTSKSTTPVMATSEWLHYWYEFKICTRFFRLLDPKRLVYLSTSLSFLYLHPQVYPWYLPPNQLLLLLLSLPAWFCWRTLRWAGPGCSQPLRSVSL